MHIKLVMQILRSDGSHYHDANHHAMKYLTASSRLSAMRKRLGDNGRASLLPSKPLSAFNPWLTLSFAQSAAICGSGVHTSNCESSCFLKSDSVGGVEPKSVSEQTRLVPKGRSIPGISQPSGMRQPSLFEKNLQK